MFILGIGSITFIIASMVVSALIILNLSILHQEGTESYFVVFTKDENIANISTSAFLHLTFQENGRLSIEALLNEFKPTNEEVNCLTCISITSPYIVLNNKNFPNIDVTVVNDKFSMFNGTEEILSNLLGMALNINSSTADIVPTIYQHINLEHSAGGKPINIKFPGNASKILILLLDGFGFTQYREFMTNFSFRFSGAVLSELSCVTAYKPITNVGTAMIVTGYYPSQSLVFDRSNHTASSEVKTVFEKVAEVGRSSMVVDGEIQFFRMKATKEYWLVDSNGDGTSDDEIFNTTKQAMLEDTYDMIFSHFHRIDDYGHQYGPKSPETATVTEETMVMVNQLINAAPNNTLIILTADHGMHEYMVKITSESALYERKGTHGVISNHDMIVPLIFIWKDVVNGILR